MESRDILGNLGHFWKAGTFHRKGGLFQNVEIFGNFKQMMTKHILEFCHFWKARTFYSILSFWTFSKDNLKSDNVQSSPSFSKDLFKD